MAAADPFVLLLLAASAQAQSPGQEGQSPPADPPIAQVGEAKDGGPEPDGQVDPPLLEFTDRNGEPLSPERQKELRAQLKQSAPTIVGRPAEPVVDGSGQIVVTGQKPRGAVRGDILPTQSLSPLEIRSYGATDVGELIQVLGSQVTSIQGLGIGGPVVLLNGKRVSSFSEIARIPTEAIERTEVFPEELALKYGYRSDQKVVNIVTYNRYSSRVGQVAFSVPTDGGFDTAATGASLLRLSGDTRVNASVDLSRSTPLLESDRNLERPGSDLGESRSRSLLPSTRRGVANVTVAGELLHGVSAALNGKVELSRARSLLGPGPVEPLSRTTDSGALHLGGTLNGSAGSWLWTATGNADRQVDTSTTDARLPLLNRSVATGKRRSGDLDVLLNGSVIDLPAGPVTTAIRFGGAAAGFYGRSGELGADGRTKLSRETASAQVNVDLPVAGPRTAGPSWLGSLSLNANGAVRHLSDLGDLRSWGLGFNWTPATGVAIIGSLSDVDTPPTVEQLGSPVIVTPAARVLDFATSRVVDVERRFGGNPKLRSERRRVEKIGVSAKPLKETDLTASVDYVLTRATRPLVPSLAPLPQLEAAFPSRFARDSTGRLVRFDASPVNFASSEQRQVRFGLNFTKPLGPVPKGMESSNAKFVGSEADLKSALPPGARIVVVEPGSAAARGFENSASRLTVSAYYTLRVTDRLLAQEGGPSLDLLDGFAVDQRGGRSRHEASLVATAFKRGLGGRMKIDWRSGSTLQAFGGSGCESLGDLTFSPLSTADLSLFVNLDERFGKGRRSGWLKGTRLSLNLLNAFGGRQEVRDRSGATPFTFSGGILDPVGRLAGLSLRKIF